MKFRLKALNYNKLQKSSSNYSYFELDPSEIPLELIGGTSN